MNKNFTLVIMAAGMGSRFGGLKQITPMGPNNEFIIDYSVYDAIKAGFNKIIFIIRKENFELFKETIGKRVENHIKVEYVFQENDNLPQGFSVSLDREKPLGTAHAIFCARNHVDSPFAIINADDFYGREAYIKAYNFLSKLDNDSNNYGIIGYKVKNTVTENGSVKRGICKCENGFLKEIMESKIEKIDGKIIASPLKYDNSFEVEEDTTVSMNFMLFTPTIFKHIEELFPRFFDENKENNLEAEFLIPDVLQKLIEEDKITVNVTMTNASWYGVTYKEDTAIVKKALSNLTNNGEYDNNLWN